MLRGCYGRELTHLALHNLRLHYKLMARVLHLQGTATQVIIC